MNIWTVYGLILLVGASQGVVLGIILWKQKGVHRLSYRFLASILFFFAYRLLIESLRMYGIGGIDSLFYYFFLEYNWIYGCLIYFFVSSYLDPTFRLSRKSWIHFLPVSIELVMSIFIKAQNLFWDGSPESLSWMGYYGYQLWMHTPFQFLVSCGLILGYVHYSRRLLEGNHLPRHIRLKHGRIRWVKHVLIAYQVFSISLIVLSLTDYLFFSYAFNPFYKFPTYIGMAVITYWLGLQAFSHRHDPPYDIKSIPEAAQQRAWEALIQDLEQLMAEQQPYKLPKLSLASVAEALGVAPQQLTQALNRSLDKRFTDYINEKRVAEVELLLQNPQYAHFTLIAIGLEAGFNSKASFNRIVKKHRGVSPRMLRSRLLDEQSS